MNGLSGLYGKYVGWVCGAMIANEYRVFFCYDKNVLELGSDDNPTILWIC